MKVLLGRLLGSDRTPKTTVETPEQRANRPTRRITEDSRSPQVTVFDPRTYNAELDALRGIAALQVVFHHLAGNWVGFTQSPLTIPVLGLDGRAFLHFGGIGVPLFFLLSGYLLTWTEENRAQRGSYSLRAYAIRRFLRLAPAFYVAMVVAFFVFPSRQPLLDLATHATFLHGLIPVTVNSLNPVFWTLGCEAVFYMLLPLIVLKLSRPWQRLALFGATFAVSLASWLYITYNAAERLEGTIRDPNLYWYLWRAPTTWLYLFIAGVLLQMLVKRLSSGPTSRWQPHAATALFLGSSLYLFILSPLGIQLPGTGSLKGIYPAPMYADLPIIALFASAILGSPLFTRILRLRVLAFAGAISYSLYLFHSPIIALLLRFLGSVRGTDSWFTTWTVFPVYMLVVLSTTCVVAYVSYRFIERPFMGYKPK